MTQCEGKLPCYITCFENHSCYLDDINLTHPSLEFNTSCTYFKIDLYRTIGMYNPRLLNDDMGKIQDINNSYSCFRCSYKYEIINKTKTISTIQIIGVNILVNYFECLLEKITPEETPLETPKETPLATPQEIVSKKKSSKNKYIIGFTIGLGGSTYSRPNFLVYYALC